MRKIAAVDFSPSGSLQAGGHRPDRSPQRSRRRIANRRNRRFALLRLQNGPRTIQSYLLTPQRFGVVQLGLIRSSFHRCSQLDVSERHIHPELLSPSFPAASKCRMRSEMKSSASSPCARSTHRAIAHISCSRVTAMTTPNARSRRASRFEAQAKGRSRYLEGASCGPYSRA